MAVFRRSYSNNMVFLLSESSSKTFFYGFLNGVVRSGGYRNFVGN